MNRPELLTHTKTDFEKDETKKMVDEKILRASKHIFATAIQSDRRMNFTSNYATVLWISLVAYTALKYTHRPTKNNEIVFYFTLVKHSEKNLKTWSSQRLNFPIRIQHTGYNLRRKCFTFLSIGFFFFSSNFRWVHRPRLSLAILQKKW